MSGWRKRTIVEMAREAGIEIDVWEPLYEGGLAGFCVCEFTNVELERFAELVRADERNRTWTQEHWTEYEQCIADQAREACEAAIQNIERKGGWITREDAINAIRAREDKHD